MENLIGTRFDYRATSDFIMAHQWQNDAAALALLASRNPAIDRDFAINQITGRQTAKTKLPSLSRVDNFVYPPQLSMEQCSSEVTARLKASLVGDATSLLDLTGGFAVDFTYMSEAMTKAVMVEHQPLLCQIAEHNLALLGRRNCEIINAEAEQYLSTLSENSFDTIYLDPARRDDAGNRVYAIDDCTPNVAELAQRLLNVARLRVIIKLSPMLDISAAVKRLPNVSEVHIVAVRNECKELLLVLNQSAKDDCYTIVCHNDDTEFSFRNNNVGIEMQLWSGEDTTAKYLYVPNVAIMKAGCFGVLSERFTDLTMIGENSHLFVSGTPVSRFPGRGFRVERITMMNRRDLKDALSGTTAANIATRNFPMSPEALRKRLELKDGGDTYIFATTQAKRHLLFICHKI